MSRSALSVCAATDTGLRRSQNEDSYAVYVPDDAGERERHGVLLVVCDGMGGSQAGEVASRMAVDTIVSSFRRGSGNEPQDEIRHALEEANDVVHQLSLADVDRQGMGTTCTAAVVRGNDLYLAQVGDSRAYLVREGRIRQLTRDHSLVAQLVERRELTPEEARVDPRRNVVTRSIGVSDTVEVDAVRADVSLEPGDTLLLCSDGLHGQLLDEELAAAVTGRNLDDASRSLIWMANERGGPDNITVVLARMEGEPAGLDAVGSAGRRRQPPPLRRPPAPRPATPPASVTAPRALALLVVALVAITLVVGAVLWLLRVTAPDSRHLDDTRDATSAAPSWGGSP